MNGFPVDEAVGDGVRVDASRPEFSKDRGHRAFPASDSPDDSDYDKTPHQASKGTGRGNWHRGGFNVDLRNLRGMTLNLLELYHPLSQVSI